MTAGKGDAQQTSENKRREEEGLENQENFI